LQQYISLLKAQVHILLDFASERIGEMKNRFFSLLAFSFMYPFFISMKFEKIMHVELLFGKKIFFSVSATYLMLLWTGRFKYLPF